MKKTLILSLAFIAGIGFWVSGADLVVNAQTENESSQGAEFLSPSSLNNWEAGQSYVISWSTPMSWDVNEVSISLTDLSGDVNVQSIGVIKDNTPVSIQGGGNYLWDIPSNIAENLYRIKAVINIQGASQSQVVLSEVFFILNSSETNNDPFIALVDGPTALNTGEQGTWAVIAADQDNDPLSYTVNWGDGSSAQTSASPSFSHTFSTAGTYTVIFTVNDGNGGTDQRTVTVQVTSGGGGDEGSGQFSVGDRVKVTREGSGLTIRLTPSIQGRWLGDRRLRTSVTILAGTVLDGPRRGDGYTWWKIRWDDGKEGWSAEGSLQGVAWLEKVDGSGGDDGGSNPEPGQFSVGDRVKSTGRVVVRLGPGNSFSNVKVVEAGSYGTILGGPEEANGFTWWRIQWHGGRYVPVNRSWSKEGRFEKLEGNLPTNLTISGPTKVVIGNETTWNVRAEDLDGDNLVYTIGWGDGDTDTVSGSSGAETEVKHTYLNSGTFNLTVAVDDGSDWPTRESKEIIITAGEEGSNLRAPVFETLMGELAQTGLVKAWTGKEKLFIFGAIDPDKGNVEYLVRWGDGTTDSYMEKSGTGITPVHTYNAPGAYNVRVKATDEEGLFAIQEFPVIVTGKGAPNVGGRVRITEALIGSSLSVRSAPTNRVGADNLITRYTFGKEGAVTDGPVNANGFVWWRVKWDDGVEGWSAEGSGGEQWLESVDGGSAGGVSVWFVNGDKVRVTSFGAGASVKSAPSETSNSVGSVRSEGDQGVVTGGPVNDSAGVAWWRVRWNDGVEGWIRRGVYLGVGAQRSFTPWIEKDERPPVSVTVSGPTNINTNNEYFWNVESSDPNLEILEYRVSWGNGESDTYYGNVGASRRISHAYTRPGSYIIGVTVTDTSGFSIYGQTSITVTAESSTGQPPQGVGDLVIVTQAGDFLTVRSEPVIRGNTYLGNKNAGSSGLVIEGPVANGGYTWWKVRWDGDSTVGWSAERSFGNGELWLEKIENNGREIGGAPVIPEDGLSGPSKVVVNETEQWVFKATDPDGGLLDYFVDWDWKGDFDSYVDFSNRYVGRPSGEVVPALHAYNAVGFHKIRLVVKDEEGLITAKELMVEAVLPREGAFRVGDRVRITGTGAGVNLYRNPRINNYDSLGRLRRLGEEGVITDGPVLDSGNTWWKIKWDEDGLEGWSTRAGVWIERADGRTVQGYPTLEFGRLSFADVVKVDETVSGRVMATDPERGLLSYSVDWGDGSDTFNATGKQSGSWITVSHRYKEAGAYTIIVTVTDSQGLTDVKNKKIIVEGRERPDNYAWLFMPGDWVEVVSGVSLEARSSPDTFSTVLRILSAGSQGVVTEGPSNTSDGVWWKIRWDNGVEGWSLEGRRSEKWLKNANRFPPYIISLNPLWAIAGLEGKLELQAFDPDVGGLEYRVDWGYGQSDVFNVNKGELITASHVYDSAGAYTAKFTATDEGGLSDKKLVSATVFPKVYEVGDKVRVRPGRGTSDGKVFPTEGVIAAEPVFRDNHIWWNIRWDDGSGNWYRLIDFEPVIGGKGGHTESEVPEVTVSGPNRIRKNTEGTWRFSASDFGPGGVGNAMISVDWGDGSDPSVAVYGPEPVTRGYVDVSHTFLNSGSYLFLVVINDSEGLVNRLENIRFRVEVTD